MLNFPKELIQHGWEKPDQINDSSEPQGSSWQLCLDRHYTPCFLLTGYSHGKLLSLSRLFIFRSLAAPRNIIIRDMDFFFWFLPIYVDSSTKTCGERPFLARSLPTSMSCAPCWEVYFNSTWKMPSCV